jgi:hypothetical protein
VQKQMPIAFVPQDIPATISAKKVSELAGVANFAAGAGNLQFATLATAPQSNQFSRLQINQGIGDGTPLDGATREQALRQVDNELMQKNLIDKAGQVTNELKQRIEFEYEFSLPTPGIIVKGCLDDCDVCEPLLQERMKLENDLLRKQIELLEKSQEYRCCPPAPVIHD